MARSLIRIGSAIAAILLVAWIYTGCSDDECPTCPETGGTGGTLTIDIMHPQPDPMRYNDVWAVASNDLFVAGEGGVVMRRRGDVWTRYDTPATTSLRSIWASSPTDVWAVGSNGVIVHFDGTTWSSMDSGVLDYLSGVWGSSPTNVYAVGDNNTVLRYMGSSWEMMDLGLPDGNRNFRDVWGFDAADIYAVGYATSPVWSGLAAHFNGSGWSEESVGGTLQSVWGVQPDTVYAGDNNGYIWRYFGAAWEQQGRLGDYINGVWGSAWNDVWAVGSRYNNVTFQNEGSVHRYDGSRWDTAPGASFPYQLNSVHGISANEVYACGDRAQVADWDGFNWEPINDAWVTGNNLRTIWGFDSGELLAFGDRGTTVQYDGTDWWDLRRITDEHLYSAWVSEPDTIYAVGQNSTIVVNYGTGWQVLMNPFFIGTLQSVWGTSTNDVRAGGDAGQIIHYDGNVLHVDTIAVATNSSILDVWGSAPDDWYAVTYNGVVHYDGNTWSPIALDGHSVRAVHGVSPTEVYFAGGSGRGVNGPAQKTSQIAGPQGRGFLLRYNGSTYTEVAADFDMSAYDVWAAGTNNVFLAGSSSDRFAIGHFNGSRVAIGSTPSAYTAYGIWATGRTAYAVGQNGVVVRVVAP